MFDVGIHYLAWHYTRAWSDITHILVNFLQAVTHFFSMKLLLRTFFSPFHKIKAKYGGGLSVEDLAGTLVTNLLMRVVGMVLRTLLLVIGFAVFVIVLFCGLVFYFIWLVLPIILLYLLIYSFILAFA